MHAAPLYESSVTRESSGVLSGEFDSASCLEVGPSQVMAHGPNLCKVEGVRRAVAYMQVQ
jgi:hypothetical protein